MVHLLYQARKKQGFPRSRPFKKEVFSTQDPHDRCGFVWQGFDFGEAEAVAIIPSSFAADQSDACETLVLGPCNHV